ncbi:hypothetical protein L1987_70890 [Smallanthus sonchifolius]|uniref:Uncharacterized protein n=1 Tax=Smallanthus sonchifolius TaxID=185202 RepID=A0ACB9ASI1_9ASTR|nr:hypothetical protein L1987_70890 [Smallanthus sonchifolius]
MRTWLSIENPDDVQEARNKDPPQDVENLAESSTVPESKDLRSVSSPGYDGGGIRFCSSPASKNRWMSTATVGVFRSIK